MVDPVNFTNYDLDVPQLEEYVLFSIAAAGKNALNAARGLDKFLKLIHQELEVNSWQPFHALAMLPKEDIAPKLKECGIGCFNLKANSFKTIATMNLDLKSCSAADLEICPGIGFKTSRLFILHTRQNAQVACLDTHILKWLNELGFNAPKASPQNAKTYIKFETIFLELANKINFSPAELDLCLWRKYSKNIELPEPIQNLTNFYKNRNRDAETFATSSR